MEVAHVGTMEAVQIDIKKAVARDHEKATEKRIVGRSNRDHRGTVAYPADKSVNQIESSNLDKSRGNDNNQRVLRPLALAA
jgi:hypothetical protein